MEELAAKEAEWVQEFSLIPTVQERLGAVVARANKRHSLTAEEKAATDRVPGCVSAVWVLGNCDSGQCTFRCDAESPMVKGLVALLCDFFSGSKASAIRDHECRLIEKLGFAATLTPTRLNGLDAVQRWIKAYAAGVA